VPLEGGSSLWGGLEPEGYDLGPREYLTVNFNTVSPGYFDLIDVPVLRGRDFDETDRAGGQRVGIVNLAFAERFWLGEDAVGKHVVARDEYEIVGVVGDAKYVTVSEERTPHIWVPAAQSQSVEYRVHVRTSGDPGTLLPTIREEVHALDRDLPIVESRPMSSLTDRAVLPYRVASVVLTAAGLIALGLAMMGVYGVMAYAVSQRTREVGIRIAVGARRESVVGMIVREGLALAVVGVVAALPLLVLLTQLIKTLVIGVRPLDPVSLVGGISLLALSAAAATLVPAVRAARVDPMVALRAE
jgi:predicted permease